MSRTGGNSYQNGLLWNGYDSTCQAWVKDGVYIRCGHPESMKCGCYGREHAGEMSLEQERNPVDAQNRKVSHA
jgi:hypothetical protein